MIWIVIVVVLLVGGGISLESLAPMSLSSSTDPNSSAVRFGKAISIAEGTYFPDGSLNPNALGASRNNPGDIEDANGEIITYPTLTDGWNALYVQAGKMLFGGSRYYRQSMTLIQVAGVYTGGDHPTAWANSVAQTLGVNIWTTLNDIAVS